MNNATTSCGGGVLLFILNTIPFDMNTKILKSHIHENWKSGLTVALISVPLSIALSIASGAGPIPGLVTGIWATLIASLFGGSNYNVVGAAGALTTVLFAGTLAAPDNLGAGILPILAIATGLIILAVWAIRADRFLYYIPSSVIYGFSAGVAFLIAVSQLFDATGLSALKRTGHFLGDIELFIAHIRDVHMPSLLCFIAFLVFILVWKNSIKKIPAVIPTSILGIVFGYLEAGHFSQNLVSLGDKFGSFTGSLFASVPWDFLIALIHNPGNLIWVLKTASVVALIAILETLITARIGDSLTKTQSSSTKELLGLALANLGSGACGGLPATGVFIRTGANIKAGATHRTSATIAAITTAIIAILVLPFFIYIPMAVIAAILVNTALGLIETHKFKEFWAHEKASFWIAFIVILITVFEDAGMAVVVGALFALLYFADTISHGRFDVILNYKNGTRTDIRGKQNLHMPHNEEPIEILTYSIAGFLGYIDSSRHAANLRQIAHNKTVSHVIIRLRDLFAMDFEGQEMLKEAITNLHTSGKHVCISSASAQIMEHLKDLEFLTTDPQPRIFAKTEDALKAIRSMPQ
jgi:sulfate permease, SulP family